MSDTRYCKDCVWYDRPRFPRCTLFRMPLSGISILAINPVTGDENRAAHYSCHDARSDEDMCGVDGKCFEYKPPDTAPTLGEWAGVLTALAFGVFIIFGGVYLVEKFIQYLIS